MHFALLFLISCIITARILDKKNMAAASIAYSVMFIIIITVLLFTSDLEIIQRTLLSFMSRKTYFNIRFMLLDAILAPQYGAYMMGAIAFMFFAQLAVVIYTATKAIVFYCFKEKSLFQKSKNACFRLVQSLPVLYIPKKINLLYCRMLN